MVEILSNNIMRAVLRHGMPLVVLGLCVAWMWPRLETINPEHVLASLAQINAYQWVLAAIFTAISFYAAGHYDVIAHRQLDTGVPAKVAHGSGMTSVALAQTFGFAFFTGTLARWRTLHGFGPGLAALVTTYVSLMILVAMIGLTAFVCLVAPVPQWVRPIAVCTLICVGITIALTIRHTAFDVRGFKVELPGLRAISATFGWTALDMAMAGLALWILIPSGMQPDLMAFFAVFGVALTAGYLIGTPGGVGPFEVLLLSLTATGLPAHTPETALLIAVLGFRVIYFACPALLAIGRMLIRPSPTIVWRDPRPLHESIMPRAETTAVIRSGAQIEQFGNAYGAISATANALVAWFDPTDAPNAQFFQQLTQRARNRNRLALLYGVSEETSSAACAEGWKVLRVADEALIDTQRYDLYTLDRASLRRMLDIAASNQITVRECRPTDTHALGHIDVDWQSARTGSRKMARGVFCPKSLLQRRVFVAEVQGEIVGFASFHKNAQEWALDVLRHCANAPDGVTHAILHAAILAARNEDVPRVSLASVTASPSSANRLWHFDLSKVAQHTPDGDMRAFAACFAPSWAPRFAAAPNKMALILGLLDIRRDMRQSQHLSRPEDTDVNVIHQNDENYEVAIKVAA